MSYEIDPKFQEPLDEEERELMDPETWNWDSIEVLPPPTNPGVVLGVCFSLEEMTSVGQAAAAEGLSIYEYIKQSALLRSMEPARR